MIDFNLHTHTKRCHHAIGEDEEYVKTAIKAGIKTLGFSDHAPYLFPSGKQQAHCIEVEQGEEYINSIKTLKRKYADKIELHVGFEMEYYPSYFDGMVSYAKALGAEYLILGQHAIYDGKLATHKRKGTREDFAEFVNCTVNAMKSGVFTYVAHPDIMQFDEDDKLYLSEMERIAKTSAELNIPLEINLLGIRRGRCYPSENFFRIAGKIGSPITLGIDAHSPEEILEKNAIAVAKNLIKRYNLNYIGLPKINYLTNF